MSHVTEAHGLQLGDAVFAHAATCVRCWAFHRMCPDAARLVRRAAKVAGVLSQRGLKLEASYIPCTLCTEPASTILWCAPPCTFLLPLGDECAAMPLDQRFEVQARFKILHAAGCAAAAIGGG